MSDEIDRLNEQVETLQMIQSNKRYLPTDSRLNRAINLYRSKEGMESKHAKIVIVSIEKTSTN